MTRPKIVRPMNLPHRWSFEYHGDTPMVCKGEHEKWEPCEWEEYKGPLIGMPAPRDPDSLYTVADISTAQLPHEEEHRCYIRATWAQDKDKPGSEEIRMGIGNPDADFANFYLLACWRCPTCKTLIFTASRRLLAQHNDECAVWQIEKAEAALDRSQAGMAFLEAELESGPVPNWGKYRPMDRKDFDR